MREPLTDATHDWHIRLQARDFQNAVRCHPRKCVAANAIRRQRGVNDVRVGVGVVRVKTRHGWTRWVWPKNVGSLINGFDDGRDAFAPGYVLELQAPQPNQQLGARAGEQPGTNKRSGTNDHTAARTPSKRHIDVDPTEEAA
jgi:hypothetical protein